MTVATVAWNRSNPAQAIAEAAARCTNLSSSSFDREDP